MFAKPPEPELLAFPPFDPIARTSSLERLAKFPGLACSVFGALVDSSRVCKEVSVFLGLIALARSKQRELVVENLIIRSALARLLT
jgi:hypothetical protein